MPARMPLPEVISKLRRQHGAPPRRLAKTAFAAVVWENACYLVDDARRVMVFQRLEKEVGLTPEAILRTEPKTLRAVLAPGGMLPAMRMKKVLTVARIGLAAGEDLTAVARRPFAEARRVLKRFPGIGEPGAEKLAMIYGGHRLLALESNGLRVLQRLGYGTPKGGYAAGYRATQRAIAASLKKVRDLPAAHELLRAHGKTTCKRSKPRCPQCPLRDSCPSAVLPKRAARD